MKQRSRNTLLLFVGILLTMAMVLLYIQSSYFKEKLKLKLIALVEKKMDSKVSIERLDGNFFTTISLTNTTISRRDSTITHLPLIYVKYDLLTLKDRIISIDSLVIDQPEFNLWQYADSTWNINALFVPREKKTKKPFEFEVHVKAIAFNNGAVEVSSFSKVIPKQTKNINIRLKGKYNKLQTKIHLNAFNFLSDDPSLEVRELSGVYTQTNGTHQFDSLTLRTGGSVVDIEANFAGSDNMQSLVHARRIDNNELAVFIPSFKLLCSPALEADLSVQNDSVAAIAQLTHKDQSIDLDLEFSTLENLLSKKQAVPYRVKLNFKNFVVKDWFELKTEDALINGKIELEGADLLKADTYVDVTARLNNSSFKEVVFDTLSFNGSLRENSLEASLDMKTKHGNVLVSGILDSISTVQNYKADIVLDQFNVNTFVPKLKGTKINGTITAQGKGLEKDKLIANADLHLFNSSVYMLPINTLHAGLQVDSAALNIDTLDINVPGAVLRGTGHLSLDSLYLDTRVAGTIRSTRVVDSLVILPIEFDSVYTVTTVSGPVKHLVVEGDVNISNADGYSASLQKGWGHYMVDIKKGALRVGVNLESTEVTTGIMEWDTARVDFDYLRDSIEIAANIIWNDTINASAKTNFTLGDTMYFVFPELEIRTMLSDYYLEDTMKVRLVDMEDLEIENLVMKDRDDAEFILSANGMVSNADTNDFKLEAKQFDLYQLNRLLRKPDSIRGILETDISITGAAQNPTIKGSAQLNQPQLGKFYLSSILANFNYADQNAYVEVSSPELENSFYATMHAQFNAYFDSLKLIFDPPEAFDAKVVIDSLQSSQIASKLIAHDSIKGIVQGEIEARGDFDNPQLYGKLNLVDGQFLSTRHGINYDHIKAAVSFNGNTISIDTFDIQQKRGAVSVSGAVDFDSTIIKGTISSSSIELEADQFFIAKHRNYEVLIDANSFIKTSEQKPEFGGTIKVIRSDIYLPAIIPEDKTDVENDVPMLVEALQTTPDTIPGELETDPEVEIIDRRSRFYENLTGRLEVEIPRNTWIKNDDMRVELSGKVDIAKTGNYFELFGNIDVIRGHYILYGRKLNVEESQIIFQGGENLDPNLNISTEYIFRGSDKEKRYLELLINGKMSEPEITFLLDGSEISESDGISILVFGTTTDEIGYGGQNGLISSVGSNAVASILTSQLSRTIGTQLNLDMIEITATESWQSAAFVVGKYITNDIFIVYQRGFGEVDDDEITPETITVEYEINDKLFLRLQSGSAKTSGMDVILKFEQGKPVFKKKEK